MFAYFTTIEMVTALGGVHHNEWFASLMFHQKFLMAFIVGYAEIRHFALLPGPKFTIFYDVFSHYEANQLLNQWQDAAELICSKHIVETKRQIEYMRVHQEYRFIKKRSLMNYLINQRLNLEKHFHNRTITMLGNIAKFEESNLTQLKQIAIDSF